MTPFSTPTAERITSAEIAAAPRGPASAKAASAATRVEEITCCQGQYVQIRRVQADIAGGHDRARRSTALCGMVLAGIARLAGRVSHHVPSAECEQRRAYAQHELADAELRGHGRAIRGMSLPPNSAASARRIAIAASLATVTAVCSPLPCRTPR